jgi:hypothetical protein
MACRIKVISNAGLIVSSLYNRQTLNLGTFSVCGIVQILRFWLTLSPLTLPKSFLFNFQNNISETRFFLRLQVQYFELRPIGRNSPEIGKINPQELSRVEETLIKTEALGRRYSDMSNRCWATEGGTSYHEDRPLINGRLPSLSNSKESCVSPCCAEQSRSVPCRAEPK